MEKSRDAVTLANLRSAYAEAQSAYLLGENCGNAVVIKNQTDDSVIDSVEVSDVVSKGTQDGLPGIGELSWVPSAAQTALAVKDSMGGTAKTWKVTFTYKNDALDTITAE